MRIEVTQADIDEGIARVSSKCALALALRRSTGQRWSVGAGYAFLPPGSPSSGIELTVRVLVFVQRFDQGRVVKPFSFEFGWDQGKGTPGTGPVSTEG